MNQQAEAWAGKFGNDYLARNRVDWRERTTFWRGVIEATKPDNVLELGANAGWNLRAIREVSPGTAVCGIDVNREAAAAARADGYLVENYEATHPCERQFDLVFTAGVLIHVAPENIEAVMQSAIDKSRRYVLAVEYSADEQEEVIYRGQTDLLWKRPFGRLYTEMGLKAVSITDAGFGFDRCTAWLMEKP